MTGTLVDGLLSSIYPAIHLIEPRYYSGSNGFEQEHAVYDFDNNIVGWTKLWKIQEILKKHSIRRTFKSVYGEESKQIFLEYVELDGHLKKLYDELETTALIELEDCRSGTRFEHKREVVEVSPTALPPPLLSNTWDKRGRQAGIPGFDEGSVDTKGAGAPHSRRELQAEKRAVHRVRRLRARA